jgi:hypothetical protein
MENTPATPVQNPLSKYFRQPSIYLKLPSNGQYWKQGSVELPVNSEIPVYPMTARDEVTLRTPDALMNGSGVVEVIQSCCPNIKNAWDMPSVDVDAVLIAIRIASYGHEMDLDTNCPYCNAENRHAIDLRVSLGTITCPDYSKKLSVDDLKIKIIPQPYFGLNKRNTIAFEEERMMKALQQPDLDDAVRSKEIADSMNRLVQLGIDTVTNSTEFIELTDGTRVANPVYIKEFYNNADGSVVRSVQQHIAEINAEGGAKSQTAPCVECKKEYQIPLMFDYSSFFETGS